MISTKASTAQEREWWKALAEIRGVIRGWSFSDDRRKRSMIEAAEALVPSLPSEALKQQARDLIRPIHDSLK